MKSLIANAFNDFKNIFKDKNIYFDSHSFHSSYHIFENSINETISKNIETINELKIE